MAREWIMHLFARGEKARWKCEATPPSDVSVLFHPRDSFGYIYIYIYRMLPIESYKFSGGGGGRTKLFKRAAASSAPCMLILACKIFRPRDWYKPSILFPTDFSANGQTFVFGSIRIVETSRCILTQILHVLVTPRTIYYIIHTYKARSFNHQC